MAKNDPTTTTGGDLIHDLLDHAAAHVLGLPSGVVHVRLIHHAHASLRMRRQMRAYARELDNEGTAR